MFSATRNMPFKSRCPFDVDGVPTHINEIELSKTALKKSVVAETFLFSNPSFIKIYSCLLKEFQVDFINSSIDASTMGDFP